MRHLLSKRPQTHTEGLMTAARLLSSLLLAASLAWPCQPTASTPNKHPHCQMGAWLLSSN